MHSSHTGGAQRAEAVAASWSEAYLEQKVEHIWTAPIYPPALSLLSLGDPIINLSAFSTHFQRS